MKKNKNPKWFHCPSGVSAKFQRANGVQFAVKIFIMPNQRAGPAPMVHIAHCTYISRIYIHICIFVSCIQASIGCSIYCLLLKKRFDLNAPKSVLNSIHITGPFQGNRLFHFHSPISSYLYTAQTTHISMTLTR